MKVKREGTEIWTRGIKVNERKWKKINEGNENRNENYQNVKRKKWKYKWQINS